MPTPLPNFKSPPLIEVVCGVQFDGLPRFATPHFGAFWERLRREYPQTEDRPPLAEILEPIGEVQQPPRVELVDLPPLRRVFFVDRTTNYLVQVQPTRFLSNWRKVLPDDDYPRFTTAYERFVNTWLEFRQFVDEMSLGALRCNQYELSYINHFPTSGSFPEEWTSFLRAAPWPEKREFLPHPLAATSQLTFRLPDNHGMLRATITHGKREADGHAVMVVDFTARGPADGAATNRDEWFSMAHEWIVRGFADLTTAAAHDRWGRLE